MLVIGAFAIPLAGLALVLRALPTELAAASPSPRPIIVDVRQAEMDGRVQATAELKWTDGTAMTAPAWSGIVTSVPLLPGDVLRSGMMVARVDEIDRLAVRTARPFHRPLQSGDRGDDVVMLRQALRELGYNIGPNPQDQFDQQVSQAVRRLEAKISHTQISESSGVFQPSWFCWLSLESFVAHEVPLAAGQPAPALGESIVVGLPKLTSISVKVADTVRLRDELYQFHYGDAVIDLDSKRTASGVGLDALSGAVSMKVAALDGHLRLVKKYTAVVIPVAAVQANANGEHCVHVQQGEGYSPVLVAVAGGGIGTAEVTFASGIEAKVLANPAEMGLTCR